MVRLITETIATRGDRPEAVAGFAPVDAQTQPAPALANVKKHVATAKSQGGSARPDSPGATDRGLRTRRHNEPRLAAGKDVAEGVEAILEMVEDSLP